MAINMFSVSHDRSNVLVVDLLNVFFSSAGKSVERFVGTVESLARSYNSHTIILCDDRKINGVGSLYRESLRPEYKANRAERRKNQSEEERDKFLETYERYKVLKDLLRNDPTALGEVPKILIEAPGVEADDLAAAVVAEFSGEVAEMWLISTDGDWDTLLKDNVFRYSLLTRKEYSLDNLYEEHGADNPQQFAELKAIVGDSGDNIIGAAGCGAKRAYGLLKEYGNIVDLALAIPIDGKQKYRQAINTMGSERLLENYALVSLVDYYDQAITEADQWPALRSKFEEIRECWK